MSYITNLPPPPLTLAPSGLISTVSLPFLDSVLTSVFTTGSLLCRHTSVPAVTDWADGLPAPLHDAVHEDRLVQRELEPESHSVDSLQTSTPW